jgi:predicted aldo/keto reductase-like oxidoreductase
MVTCRSCIHIDPYLYGDKGSWECKYFGNVLPTEDQHRACPNHVYIPSLLQNWALVKSVDVEENAIEYVNQLTGKTFWNGRADSHYSSLEISVCADKRIIGDPDVDLAKKTTGGRLRD